jgi:hypothetical protein
MVFQGHQHRHVVLFLIDPLLNYIHNRSLPPIGVLLFKPRVLAVDMTDIFLYGFDLFSECLDLIEQVGTIH